MWQPVIDCLPDFHCLAPDLPEHGRSTGQPFSIRVAAQLVAELVIERAHRGTAHLVGLSLGAQVLVALLAQSPHVAASAVISSALLRPLPGTRLGLYSPALAKAIYWSAIAPFKKWDAWIRLNMKYSAGIPDAHFADFKREFQQQTPSSWSNVFVENMHFRLPQGLTQVKAPVLVLAGSKEYRAMRQSAHDLVKALPAAQFVNIPSDPGWTMAQQHNWALTAPDRFADLVREWINTTTKEHD